MPRPRLLLACVPLLVAAVACGRDGGGASRGGPGSGPAGPPPSVTVTPVLALRLADERERVGQVRAVEDVELRARISGFLEERLFEEGSDVEKGDLLFVIEQAPYEARVSRAEAELARAKAALQEAELELRRTRRLRGRNVTSEAELDAAVASEAQATAEVLAAEASLAEARLDLDYTTIHAPVSGRVGRAAYSVGDLVGPESGPLATLATLDPIHVYWQVPEDIILDFRRRNVQRAQRGEEPESVSARLRFRDGSLYEHEGVWDFLDNRVDPTTGTQTARAVFPNPDALLLPGQYATVIVQVGAPRRTLVVPQAAVQEDQAGRFVLVVDDEDVARLRRVEMGARQGIYWAVRSGLSAGDRVVYQGVQKARPDAPVAPKRVLPDPPVGSVAARPATAEEPAPAPEAQAAASDGAADEPSDAAPSQGGGEASDGGSSAGS